MQRKEKLGLGCATLIMAILLCKFVFGPHPVPNMPQTADAATPAPTPTMQATATPTPGPQPSPTPQQAVQPTQAPIVQPTQAPIVQPTPTTPPVVSQTPTQPLTPQPTQPPAVTYNTDPNGGQRVYNPPVNFCTTHACVSTFWTDKSGYVVECGNGKYSHSGGVSGACSRDGKVAATLYQHG
jgi:hypothetical protein